MINREAGREGGCGKDTISRQFPSSDVDSDLTTLGIAEQDCANLRGKQFSDKKGIHLQNIIQIGQRAMYSFALLKVSVFQCCPQAYPPAGQADT